MKLSFSTVGCPEWMLNEVLAAASDFGYDGVEIRGLGEDIFLPKAPCFGPKRLKTSIKEIAEANVEISCLSSDASCLLSSHSLDVPSNGSRSWCTVVMRFLRESNGSSMMRG